MKNLKFMLAAAAMTLSISVFAAGPARKETVIEAGRIRIVASVPAEMTGPTGFEGSKGIAALDLDDGNKSREASFGTKISDIGGDISYNVKIVADAKNGVPYDEKWLADYMFRHTIGTMKGATPIDPPKVAIPGAKVVAYQSTGSGAAGRKFAVYVVAVSIPSIRSAYAYAVDTSALPAVFDKNARNFDDLAFASIMDFKKASTFEVR